MKKQLLALAALATLAGGAMAQSSVTLYGVVDVGLERTRLSPGDSTVRLSSGIQSGSRWGVKGKEDLGGGLSASFQLEAGFDVSTGARAQGGLAFGRQSWVGLNGGWGSVKLGRQYVPYFLAQDTIDPFGTGIVGDASGMAAVFNPYGVRMDNAINYSTPNFGGFSAEVAYGFGEIPGSTSRASQYGFAAYYDKAPVTAVLAYHKQNLAAGIVNAGEASSWLVGGVFDFKMAKLHAAYADNRAENAFGFSTSRSRDYMLGLSAPVGPVTVMATYMRHKERNISNADADFWGIGATYALSKRTNFYTSYSRVNNDALGATATGVAGQDANWINVGIRHAF